MPAAKPDADEICARLERIQKLCKELELVQNDTRKCHRLLERIRTEAESFRRTLGTHDSSV